MWIYTKRGFYSAVEDRDNHRKVWVRARDRKDLERLEELYPVGLEIIETPPPRDYAFRVHLEKVVWAGILTKLALEITYDNFKNEVGRRDRNRASIYSRIWGETLAIQDRPPFSRSLYWDEDFEVEEEDETAPCGCSGPECRGECPSADLAFDASREGSMFGRRLGR